MAQRVPRGAVSGRRALGGWCPSAVQRYPGEWVSGLRCAPLSPAAPRTMERSSLRHGDPPAQRPAPGHAARPCSATMPCRRYQRGDKSLSPVVSQTIIILSPCGIFIIIVYTIRVSLSVAKRVISIMLS